jgi:hypothetical protein
MKSLSETWFAEGYIDFELKQYTLLAYLKEINNGFREKKLYPSLADIIFHYKNMIAFRDNKQQLQNEFPKRLTGIHLEKLTLLYEQVIKDDQLMQELSAIIGYATNKMESTIKNGTAIYESVESTIKINPVGIVPLDTSEGYFFLTNSGSKDTLVYQYRIAFLENKEEKHQGIKIALVDNYNRSICCTPEQIKLDLIRKKTQLPNPAVYSIDSAEKFPIQETLLPVAKRYLARYIATAA